MRYAEAIRRLFALQSRGIRLGIDRMRDGLAYRRLAPSSLPPLIQVAGTNGKGSVSAMLARALQAAGYRTGLFSSPHLHRFTERIQLDGEPLASREAARRIEELLALFGKPRAPFVSFFELSTLMAAEVFRDHGCDVAVMEVGLGGRLDATNALPAVLTLITRIARDHERVLGHRLSQIAREKAGIIKPGVPVIVGSRAPEALRVIRAAARAARAPMLLIDHDFVVLPERSGHRVAFGVGTRRFGPVQLALLGEHQHDNAACAVAGLCELNRLGFSIDARAIRTGLTRVHWPARLEHIPGRPAYLLDAAHNPDGCAALAEYLRGKPRTPRALVFGVMQDKDYPAMLRSLAPLVDRLFYAPIGMPRAAAPEHLASVVPGELPGSLARALSAARRAVGPRGLVVVAGSIFMVANVRAKLLGLASDPLIRL